MDKNIRICIIGGGPAGLEAARIARGNVKPIEECRVEDFDAVVFPGGNGSAKNLFTYALEGASCSVREDVAKVIRAFHNAGNAKLKQRSWQEAIDDYKNALRRNPGDMETKANLAYAQKMLENEQQNGGGGGNDQNQNQDQNQDQNNDQNQDQNQDQNNQDQNNDQNQDNQDQNDQNQDQNQNNQNDQDQDQQQNQDQQQGQQPKITPQSAQQMLQAIQAQEKDTQDKVKKEKAARLKSKQKEKNW